ncbi:MAG: hydrolase [Planctomycetota bacterium]
MAPPQPTAAILRDADDTCLLSSGEASALNHRLADTLAELAEINSGSQHAAGIEHVAQRAVALLQPLADTVTRIAVPPRTVIRDDGNITTEPVPAAVRALRRADHPRRVLLNIHLDTVYPIDHPFQTVERPDPNTLHGPGVADAKGGLLVLLAGLDLFEQHPDSANLGWEVLLTTDEEVGSESSLGLLRESAQHAMAGLVYEPTLPNGNLIDARPGSGNYTVVVRGKAAHAGRDFDLGKNAVAALCHLFTQLDHLTTDDRRVRCNLGQLTGGGPVNVVPDFALGRFNLRVDHQTLQQQAIESIERLIESTRERFGVDIQVHGHFQNPPKPRDPVTDQLIDLAQQAGQSFGLQLNTQPSGGVCDGNKLAGLGLPTLDTLGPRGGAIHSPDEFLLIDSLAERAQLTAQLLLRLARLEHPLPRILSTENA